MSWSAFQKDLASKTRKLNKILPEVMEITGYERLSLNAKIGGKNAEFMDINNEVILSPDHFVALWMKGLIRYLDDLGQYRERSNIYELLQYIQKHQVVRDYAFTFLERTYMRNYTALSKKRPKVEEAAMWIGQENATYGILVTPRFSNGNWENDVSEIRHFKKKYWTIGHVLETGLVVPFENEKIEFPNVEQYLKFFKNVLVRGSGSKYELEIANNYCELVRNSDDPEEIPLLIPEFRYGGLERKHKYRLDFTIIDPNTLNKYGFELSPWSTHGHLSGTKDKLQKDINAIALGNFEKEMKKLKDYFREFGIYALIYTDSDLANIEKVFSDMKKYLNPYEIQEQLKLHVLDDFLSYS